MASVSSEFTPKIKSILQSNGISDPISEAIFGDSGLKGENFASLTEYVTVKFEEKSSGRKPLHLFVKFPVANETYNQMIQDWQLFQKEAVFFTEYLPKARQYCKSKGHEELMDIYPKCYHADDKLIVFENLVLERGFLLLDKEEKQGYETAKLALTNLAKHHAISHALIEEHGGAEFFFRIFPQFRFEYFRHESTRALYSPGLDNSIDMFVSILEKSGELGGGGGGELEEAIEKLKGMKGKQFDEMLESLNEYEGEFMVLNHGDYWNNNMMFLKVDEEGDDDKLTAHIAIDFQAVRYASPCVDLGYYLYLSVKPEVRRGRWDDLLGIYLEALKDTATELGHPLHLSIEKLKSDFSKHFQFGYWQGLDVATRAGYAVLKDMDMGEGEDVSDWFTKYNQLVRKWMEEHPEECSKNAEIIMEYWKEYGRFTTESVT